MIKLENVSFSYRHDIDTEQQTLTDINLVINDGEFVSVIGDNGSGKSTLSLLLNGLLVPDKGIVSVEELTTTSPSNISNIRLMMGLLFQNPDNQIIASIVEEDVAFGPQNLGLERLEIVERVKEALDLVAITSIIKHDPNNLSAGQKQKVALAGLLALRPKYLILDEPTSYLDPASSIEVMSIIKDLCIGRQLTVVNITHSPEQLLLGKRVVLLDRGKIVFDGPVSEFFENVELLNLSGFTKPFFYDVKRKLINSYPAIGKVNSNKELAEYICSLN